MTHRTNGGKRLFSLLLALLLILPLFASCSEKAAEPGAQENAGAADA